MITPISLMNQGLVKAFLEIEKPEVAEPVIPLRFNPTEYQLQKTNNFSEIAIPGLESPPIQFVRGAAETLSVEFLVDTSDTLEDVREKYVDTLRGLLRLNAELHAPPIVRFIWDTQIFRGVLESLDTTFVLFSPEGVPLRARLAVKLKEYRPVEIQVKESPKNSPDIEKTYVARRGDTLSSIAAAVYRDAGQWRAIARENGIRDPRRLPPGTVLDRTATQDQERTDMTVASVRSSGLPATDYYAPDFKVEVKGGLDPASKGDILDVKVVMDMDNITSCDLTVNDWNDRTLAFKYSDTEVFDVGNRVHVQMGYAGALRSMMRGQVTTLTPKFPESGSPTLGLSVLDGMLKLRDRKPKPDDVKRFENKADWEIAELVAARNGLRAKVTKEGEVHPQVVQKNQDDAQFLMERAKRIDFDCYVQTDPDSGEDILFFVRPTDARGSEPTRVYQLEWGESLIFFNPKLTLSRQVGSVTVRGWDPATKSAISYTATPEDLPGSAQGGTSGPKAAEKKLPNKEETVIDAPILSEQEAKDLAIALLTERAYEFITGSGKVIGLPDLRPGDNLEIDGLGRRFSGLYYVKKVEHALGNSGYTTQFDVRRVFDGGLE